MIIAVAILVIGACKSKKNTVASAPPDPAPANAAVKSPDGIYAPGHEELAAIQVKYSDVTLERLNQGHVLYAYSACIRCHAAQNIYKYDEARWKEIIDNMAPKAQISDSQKDAVYKYVLAIKATQQKGAR